MSRKMEIRQAAVRLFYERGYYGTSLKDVADAVNLRAPSLYNHIESKQKLLQEIMFDGIVSLAEEFESAVASSDVVTEQLRLATEAHIRHHARSSLEAHVNTYEIASLEEPARSDLLELRRSYARAWEALIQRGIDEGVFLTSQPKLAAFSIIDLGAGVARWYRPTGQVSEDALISYYGKLSLQIVGAAKALEAVGSRVDGVPAADSTLMHF
jgi:AcrR family transcriptional regulator